MSHPLNDVVWCRLGASFIHGVGVFAIRDIPKGTQLFGGANSYDRSEEETVLPEIMSLILDRYAFVEYFGCLPNPNHDAVMQRFMNHSDAPNSDGKSSLRYIAAGEEVTENYKAFSRPLGPKALAHYNLS